MLYTMAMFDFFGSKDDRREELEENIAQIRQKVQQEGMEGASGSPSRDMRPTPAPAQEPAEDVEPPRERPTEPEEPAAVEESEPPVVDRNDVDAPVAPPRLGDEDSEQGAASRQEPEQRASDEVPPEARQDAPPEPQEPQRAQRSQGAQEPEHRSRNIRQPSREPDQDTSPAASRPSPSSNTTPNDRDRPPAPSPDAGQRSPGPQPGARERKEQGAGVPREDIPKPPEMRDLDIPDIERGPLFITVNKFKNALSTLSEMRAASDELESSVGSLENTLAEDREREETLREVLDQTISNVEVIQEIVSPENRGS